MACFRQVKTEATQDCGSCRRFQTHPIGSFHWYTGSLLLDNGMMMGMKSSVRCAGVHHFHDFFTLFWKRILNILPDFFFVFFNRGMSLSTQKVFWNAWERLKFRGKWITESNKHHIRDGCDCGIFSLFTSLLGALSWAKGNHGKYKMSFSCTAKFLLV